MESLEKNLFKTYQLRSLLELGRLSEAWLATRLDNGREVVVKLIPLRRIAGQTEKANEHFTEIAAKVAGLEHPNIMPVLDYGRAEGYFYLVTPFAPNGSLQQRLQLEAPTQNQAIELALQVLSGLAYAHGQGVVHGQLSPVSLWLDETGRWRIDDFVEAEIERRLLKQTGELKPPLEDAANYLAPEQYQGQVRPQSDLYAVGVLLYRLLTGQLPNFEAGQPAAFPHPLVLPSLESVLVKALQKAPEQRFNSADEMAAAIKTALERTQPRPISQKPIYQTTRQTPPLPPESDKAKTKSFPAAPELRNAVSASQPRGQESNPFELTSSGLFSISSKPPTSATKSQYTTTFSPENAVTAPYSFSGLLNQLDGLEPEEQTLFQFGFVRPEKTSFVPELTGLIFLLMLAIGLATLVVFLSL
jgi:serine/threonine protein kinase